MSLSEDSPYLERTNTAQLDSPLLSLLNRDEYTKFPDLIQFLVLVDNESRRMFGERWSETYKAHPSDATNILNKVIDRITDEQAEQIVKQYYSAHYLLHETLQNIIKISGEDICTDEKLLKYSKIVELTLLHLCNDGNLFIELDNFSALISAVIKTGYSMLNIEPFLTVAKKDRRYKKHFLDRISEAEAIRKELQDVARTHSTKEKVMVAKKVVEKFIQAIDIHRIIKVMPKHQKTKLVDLCCMLGPRIHLYAFEFSASISSSATNKENLKDMYMLINTRNPYYLFFQSIILSESLPQSQLASLSIHLVRSP